MTTQTNTNILIIGAGISGLATAWHLSQLGKDFLLLESRTRIGGRVLTVDRCDLGPSWIWPGQPRVANALKRLAIPVFDQFSHGDTLFQDAKGAVHVLPQPSPMQGSLRIQGGVSRLATEMAEQIDPNRIRFQHAVHSIARDGDSVNVQCKTPNGEQFFSADQIVIAIPPRLAANIEYSPALPDQLQHWLESTPTWMAGHAKFFAIYETPFWRTQGLCGSATSREGPLAEIHDATPMDESQFALFGFAGHSAPTRARMTPERLRSAALDQLAQLFGPEAQSPTQTHYQDWSREDSTAANSDRVPQTRHPEYGLPSTITAGLKLNWDHKIAFTVSETSIINGGLIEGALEAAQMFVTRFVQTGASDSGSDPHTASMGWDWL